MRHSGREHGKYRKLYTAQIATHEMTARVRNIVSPTTSFCATADSSTAWPRVSFHGRRWQARAMIRTATMGPSRMAVNLLTSANVKKATKPHRLPTLTRRAVRHKKYM